MTVPTLDGFLHHARLAPRTCHVARRAHLLLRRQPLTCTPRCSSTWLGSCSSGSSAGATHRADAGHPPAPAAPGRAVVSQELRPADRFRIMATSTPTPRLRRTRIVWE